MADLLKDIDLLPKLYFGLGLGALTIIVPYILSILSSIQLSRRLSKFPFVNKKWDAAAKKHFQTSAEEIIQEGAKLAKGEAFLLNDKSNPRLVLPAKYIDEYKNDKRLDFHGFIAKEFFSTYPGFDAFSVSVDQTIFQDAVRTQLTQALTLTVATMAKEAPNTLNLVYGDAPDWKTTVLTPTLLRAVGRLTALIFLGDKFMDNPQWQQISIMYTVDAFLAARALNEWPAFARPFVHWFLPECKKIRSEVKVAKALIQPEVDKRCAELAANGVKPRLKVLDSVDWFYTSAKGKQFDYANAELSLAMASIHTTTNTVGYALFDLIENPEYIDMLRKEIKEVYEEEGKWEKSTLFKLKLMDSCLKESMRLHPHSLVNMPRQATSDITLKDGTVIPKNAYTSIGPIPMHDPSIYPAPFEFHGRRFLDLREAPGALNKHQFVTTSVDMTVFGHGSHACPGRFFASNEIKLLLAHMLMYYDWKLPDGQDKVQHTFNGSGRSPNARQAVQYKSRTPEVHL